jgi:2'-5' RNA ligase
VTFDRISRFKSSNRRPLVLRCGLGLAELTTLREALTSAMRRIGLASRSAFTPHVTLLYDRQSVPETRVDGPITWTVRDFVLVHGLQGQGRHMDRACWPLRG